MVEFKPILNKIIGPGSKSGNFDLSIISKDLLMGFKPQTLTADKFAQLPSENITEINNNAANNSKNAQEIGEQGNLLTRVAIADQATSVQPLAKAVAALVPGANIVGTMVDAIDKDQKAETGGFWSKAIDVVKTGFDFIMNPISTVVTKTANYFIGNKGSDSIIDFLANLIPEPIKNLAKQACDFVCGLWNDVMNSTTDQYIAEQKMLEERKAKYSKEETRRKEFWQQALRDRQEYDRAIAAEERKRRMDEAEHCSKQLANNLESQKQKRKQAEIVKRRRYAGSKGVYSFDVDFKNVSKATIDKVAMDKALAYNIFKLAEILETTKGIDIYPGLDVLIVGDNFANLGPLGLVNAYRKQDWIKTEITNLLSRAKSYNANIIV